MRNAGRVKTEKRSEDHGRLMKSVVVERRIIFMVRSRGMIGDGDRRCTKINVFGIEWFVVREWVRSSLIWETRAK